MKKKIVWAFMLLLILIILDGFHHAKLYYFFANIVGSPIISQYCDNVLMQAFPLDSRFWLHGCNNVVKLQTIGQKYAGVEVDVIYYEGEDIFGVSHEREEAVSLPLENVIDYLAKGNQKVWLDFKNLTDENQETSRNCLNAILARCQFEKGRVIVESNHPRALEFYTADGFYTSYYCPIEDKKTFSSEQAMEAYIQNVRQVAGSGKVKALSCAYNYYTLVRRAAPDADLLVWERNDDKWWGFYLLPSLSKICGDENVKVILVWDRVPDE